jgi:hypothetical protein
MRHTSSTISYRVKKPSAVESDYEEEELRRRREGRLRIS